MVILLIYYTLINTDTIAWESVQNYCYLSLNRN